jgi:hypothetical protein
MSRSADWAPVPAGDRRGVVLFTRLVRYIRRGCFHGRESHEVRGLPVHFPG